MLLLSAELMVQLHCLLMVFGRVLCDMFLPLPTIRSFHSGKQGKCQTFAHCLLEGTAPNPRLPALRTEVVREKKRSGRLSIQTINALCHCVCSCKLRI